MQDKGDEIVFIILTTTALLFILAVLIITILYLYQRRQMFYFKKIDSLKQNFEKELLQTQIELHENLLNSFSREIHDNIGLSLTLAKLNLNTLNSKEDISNKSKIEMSINLLSKAISDLRNLSKGLNSDRINKNGLVKSLEEEIETIKLSKLIKISLEVNGIPNFLDPQKELLLFRIIQESLNNIIKHSNANTARIILQFNESNFNLKIIDNGIGFDTSSMNHKKGSGLFNINSRIKVMNGVYSIHSNKQGTFIDIIIPY